MDEGRDTRPARAPFSDDTTDLVLLTRINRGDREALRELYTLYYHPLLRFIYRITGQLELAQEGINDVMLVVWKSGNSFGGKSKVATWIMGIAYNRSLKLLQKSRRWSDRVAAVDFDDWIERSEAAEEHTEQADLRDLLDHGLRQLSPEHRAVVELTYFYGCSYEEIAAIAGCPVNTVKTRMFHARAKLKKLLPDLGKTDF
ncbi:MAG TPA: sigma-70 family RNA polymerase sigma factor [Gammaproteobacteria bacterium]|nr:sigma-70 family RNA polymerase sigma factor [Gammaproteobacteria bacterium]